MGMYTAVERDKSGNFVIVVDTDNDEDLSDEKAAIFPWEGPPIDPREFMSQVHSTHDYLTQVGSLPDFLFHSSSSMKDGLKTPKSCSPLHHTFPYPVNFLQRKRHMPKRDT